MIEVDVKSPVIPVAETFYSIQGEGPTAGVPAVFLRTSGCNLTCPAWPCDTTEVWQKVWRAMTFLELYEYWRRQGWLTHLSWGAHLIITGGEPLLHQFKLADFLPGLMTVCSSKHIIEVETNGTIAPIPRFDRCVSQYNVSPKLASSGNPQTKRYKSDALEFFAGHPDTFFKFVIADPDRDWTEINEKFLVPFNISRNRVYLMPMCANLSEWQQNAPDVAELAKTVGAHFSPRLQILIWGKVTGV